MGIILPSRLSHIVMGLGTTFISGLATIYMTAHTVTFSNPVWLVLIVGEAGISLASYKISATETGISVSANDEEDDNQ
jgi:hypothetical protein